MRCSTCRAAPAASRRRISCWMPASSSVSRDRFRTSRCSVSRVSSSFECVVERLDSAVVLAGLRVRSDAFQNLIDELVLIAAAAAPAMASSAIATAFSNSATARSKSSVSSGLRRLANLRTILGSRPPRSAVLSIRGRPEAGGLFSDWANIKRVVFHSRPRSNVFDQIALEHVGGQPVDDELAKASGEAKSSCETTSSSSTRLRKASCRRCATAVSRKLPGTGNSLGVTS